MMQITTEKRTLPWRYPLPHQLDAFLWEPQETLGILALLGGWGSGKSEGAAYRFFRECIENPYRPWYGTRNPTSIIVAPTHKILMQATVEAFLAKCNPDIIFSRRGPPHNDIMLSNGHRILLHSGEGELEGITACCVWIDEIQHPTFSNHPKRYLNLLARLRDPHADRTMMIVSGLPESGWVRDTFGTESASRKTILAGTRDNPHIPPALLRQFFESVPSGQEEMLLGGQWMSPVGAIYSQYNPEKHLTKMKIEKLKPTHIGMDVGNFGAILAAQHVKVEVKDIMGFPRTETGLLVFDQILTHNESCESQCLRIKLETDWAITPETTICVDPTIRRDELQTLYKHFPNCRIIKRDRGHETYPVEAGIRLTQLALLDAAGNSRLLFHRNLLGTKHGIIEFIESYRRSEKTNQPIRDNLRDHIGDCLRYLVAEHLRAERPVSVHYR